MITFQEWIPGWQDQKPHKRTGHFLSNLIIERKFSTIAELGIMKGNCSRMVLEGRANIYVRDYIAVDSWYTKDHRYRKLLGMYAYQKQLRVVRLDTVDAANLFWDGYFDCVFVDADHTYDGVIADLKAWLPKVRKGGIICGHDYAEVLPRIGEPNHNPAWAVNDAVDDFFGKGAVTLWDNYWCWGKEIE